MNTKDIFEILPQAIIKEITNEKDIEKLQEIRIKVNKPLIVNINNKEIVKNYLATSEDVKLIIQKISNYSIYAFEDEIKNGYITVKGGHRVGICGNCVIQDESIKTIKDISSLNIRTCKEVVGCSVKIIPYIVESETVLNTIIISPPQCGKTTLLRDMVRNLSDGRENMNFKGKKVTVIDERSEIAGCYNGIPQMNVGIRTDILDNCPKSKGIMLAIRSLSPEVIVCDEIGTRKDVESLMMATNCGVSIITTIHGEGIEDISKRKVFNEIIENRLFKRAIILSCKKGVGTIEAVYDFQNDKTLWRQ